MQTACPYCDTQFRVDSEFVEKLDARVRCGLCHTVFNARDQLVVTDLNGPAVATSELPPTQESAIAAGATVDRESTVRSSRFDFDRVEDIGVEMDDTLRIEEESVESLEPEDRSIPAELEDQPEALVDEGPDDDIFDAPVNEIDDSEIVEDAQDVDTLFASNARREGGWQRRFWVVGSCVLVLAVCIQWVYANRLELIESPQVRPLLQQLCVPLGCELEPLRDLEQIELLRRSVYSHPNIENALIISLAMVNNASYAQAFPVLLIRMADVRGQIVAQRDFLPQDYLDGTGAASDMAPGAPVTVTLEIHDPGNDALTFELEFK